MEDTRMRHGRCKGFQRRSRWSGRSGAPSTPRVWRLEKWFRLRIKSQRIRWRRSLRGKSNQGGADGWKWRNLHSRSPHLCTQTEEAHRQTDQNLVQDNEKRWPYRRRCEEAFCKIDREGWRLWWLAVDQDATHCFRGPFLPRNSTLWVDYKRKVANSVPEQLAGNSRLKFSVPAHVIHPKAPPCLLFPECPWSQVLKTHVLGDGNLCADAMDNAVTITWWAVENGFWRHGDGGTRLWVLLDEKRHDNCRKGGRFCNDLRIQAEPLRKWRNN